jgi:putative thioredoxin
MGISIETDSNNFATEVVEQSYQQPVVVDFYATWCGPCKILKPILEKLSQEYEFTLAKIDIDQNQDLANAYHVEGVPDVRVVNQGEVLPGFVGVLPEPKIREMLEQFNFKSSLEIDLESLKKAVASGDAKQAKKLLDELFNKYPGNPRITIEAAKFLISLNRFEDATKLLDTIPPSEREIYSEARGVKAIIHFKQEAENPGETDLDKSYSEACRLTLASDYDRALQLFLEIVGTSRKYKDDGARKAMLSIFNLLGDEHPLTQQYRKELMLQLY